MSAAANSLPVATGKRVVIATAEGTDAKIKQWRNVFSFRHPTRLATNLIRTSVCFTSMNCETSHLCYVKRAWEAIGANNKKVGIAVLFTSMMTGWVAICVDSRSERAWSSNPGRRSTTHHPYQVDKVATTLVESQQLVILGIHSVPVVAMWIFFFYHLWQWKRRL